MKVLTSIISLVLLQEISSAIDLRFMNESVNPCEDFYEFACGNFKTYHPRPPGEDNWDLFRLTENDLVRLGKEILKLPNEKSESVAWKKAKSAYKSCVNAEQLSDLEYYKSKEIDLITEFGGMPLIDDALTEPLSWKQIGNLSGSFGIHNFFQFKIRVLSPGEYALIMYTEDTIDLPHQIKPESTKTYDQVLEESFKKMALPNLRKVSVDDSLDIFINKTAYHLLDIHHQLKRDHVAKDLNDMKEFMAKLFDGGIIPDNMTGLSPPPAASLKDFQDWSDKQFGEELGLNWVEYFEEIFKWSDIDIDENFLVFLLPPGDSIYGILNLIQQTNPRVIKNFLLLRTILFMSPDSDTIMRQYFEEYYKSLNLTYYTRSDYCARKVLDVVDSPSLSFAIAYEYANYHFDINKIPQAVKIIQNVKNVFKDNLKTLDWVDEPSRQAVSEKLDNIVFYLGYPDFVDNITNLDRFYQNVRICEWDYYGNARRIRAFKEAYYLSQLRSKKDLWATSPFQVNAFALRGSLGIMTPLALLHSNFLHGADTTFDYSHFGDIVSHELTHHFDSIGIDYNATGYYDYTSGLLSKATDDTFRNIKIQCFVNQYNNYKVEGIDTFVNGTVTLPENIADNVGLRHAFQAFTLEKNTKPNATYYGKYTEEQLFFINFGMTWCNDDSDTYNRQLLSSTGYPPSKYRVLGTLSNSKEFAEAFNCPIGSEMNPVTKCDLW